MRWLFTSAIVACVFATVATPAAAQSTAKLFAETWEKRHATYQMELSSGTQRFEAAAAQLSHSLNVGDASFGPALEQLEASAIALGYADGRLAAVRQLREFMAGKPKPVAIEIWLQGQADSLKRFSDDVAATAQSIRAKRPGENGLTVNSLLQELTLSYIHIGKVRGAADEMLLIRANLQTFMREKRARDERGKAAAAAAFQGLSDFGKHLSGNPWTATCSLTGNSTTCWGR